LYGWYIFFNQNKYKIFLLVSIFNQNKYKSITHISKLPNRQIRHIHWPSFFLKKKLRHIHSNLQYTKGSPWPKQWWGTLWSSQIFYLFSLCKCMWICVNTLQVTHFDEFRVTLTLFSLLRKKLKLKLKL